MNIEELAFKDRKNLANLNELDLLDIIEFLQKDRKEWINQFTQTHNESVDIQKENQELKKQLHEASLTIQEMTEQDIECPSNCEKLRRLKKLNEEKTKIGIADHKYASKCEDKVIIMEAQQKEFIEWLENYLKLFDNMDIDQQGDYDMLEEILQKYKSIIGVSDDNKAKV